MNIETKTCASCKVTKSITEFTKRTRAKDGLDYYCKGCNFVRYERRDREAQNATNRARYAANPAARLAANKQWRDNRTPAQRQRAPIYRIKRRSLHAAYQRERIKKDVNFRLAARLRTRLCVAVQQEFKTGSAVTDLGCSIAEFKVYMESKFQAGMNWENWGRKGWHIDHIEPLTGFDLTNREEFRKAAHFTNLQPLWWDENIKKGGA